METQPYYQTIDTVLASVLAACGVPWAKDEHGNEVRYLNIYDTEALRKLGYRGWELELAARDAWKSQRPGKIVYQFLRCEALEQILEGYHKHCRRLADPDKRDSPLAPLQISHKEIGTFVAQFMSVRKQILAEWPLVTPHIVVHGESRSQVNGQKQTTYGSFKLRLLTAGEAVRKHLGF